MASGRNPRILGKRTTGFYLAPRRVYALRSLEGRRNLGGERGKVGCPKLAFCHARYVGLLRIFHACGSSPKSSEVLFHLLLHLHNGKREESFRTSEVRQPSVRLVRLVSWSVQSVYPAAPFSISIRFPLYPWRLFGPGVDTHIESSSSKSPPVRVMNAMYGMKFQPIASLLGEFSLNWFSFDSSVLHPACWLVPSPSLRPSATLFPPFPSPFSFLSPPFFPFVLFSPLPFLLFSFSSSCSLVLLVLSEAFICNGGDERQAGFRVLRSHGNTTTYAEWLEASRYTHLCNLRVRLVMGTAIVHIVVARVSQVAFACLVILIRDCVHAEAIMAYRLPASCLHRPPLQTCRRSREREHLLSSRRLSSFS